MKTLTFFLTLCLSLTLIAGCTGTPATPSSLPAATNPPPASTNTPQPPTPASTTTLLPPQAQAQLTPTPTCNFTDAQVQATETAVVAPQPKPEWIFAAGNAILSPATVVDGVIYFGSDDGTLYAVNLSTHDLKWKYQTGGAVRSQPAVDLTLVYAASDDSDLYAISKSDGTLAWKSQIERSPIQRSSSDMTSAWDWYTSSPVLQDTTLYIGSTDGNLYALDTQTGKTLWKFDTTASIRTTPLVANGLVYIGNTLGDYFAIDAKVGTEVWNYSTKEGNSSNGMALVDNIVYFVSSTNFHALEAKTGAVKWTRSMGPGSNFKPVSENGILYADGYDESGCYRPVGAYDAGTGKLVWVPNFFLTDMLLTSVTIGQNSVYFGADHEGLYALDKKTGEIKWKLVVSGAQGSGVNANATVADGMVYFGGMDGKLYAVKDQ